MSTTTFATNCRDPWCPGCGHSVVTRALQDALARRFQPHEIVLVSDIGCIGMADVMFTCHTVHGLHGRSPALAAGVAMNLDAPGRKKVVAVMGDGGAAIGLQHVMECARLNVDLTLVVCNNQNYGMTGGQHSAYTASGLRTTTTPEGNPTRPFPLCELVAPLGVFRARVPATSGELHGILDQALAQTGFALVETFNYCPAYAGKMNPDQLSPKEMKRFFEATGLTFGTWPATVAAAPFRFEGSPRPPAPKPIAVRWSHNLRGTVDILLAGSAGEGVQTAGELFAKAAIACGLEVALRSEYPVTVGKGFSSAFLRLSDRTIGSPVTDTFDVGLVTSVDGLKWLGARPTTLRRAVIDPSVEAGPAWADAKRLDVRRFGAKQAAFAGLAWLLAEQGWFPVEALREAASAVSSAKAKDALGKVLDAFDTGVPA